MLLLFVGLIFVAPLLGVLGGAFAGWIVSLAFDDTIRSTFAALGLPLNDLQLWQVGATLGFVGGFFKAHQTNNNR